MCILRTIPILMLHNQTDLFAPIKSVCVWNTTKLFVQIKFCAYTIGLPLAYSMGLAPRPGPQPQLQMSFAQSCRLSIDQVCRKI